MPSTHSMSTEADPPVPSASLPIGMLLQQERQLHSTLCLLSIRQQRVVEKFYGALEEIERERQRCTAKLLSVNQAIDVLRRQFSLLECPTELRTWRDAVLGVLPSAAGRVLPGDGDEFVPAVADDAAVAADDSGLSVIFSDNPIRTLPLSATHRQNVEEQLVTASAQTPCRLQRATFPDILARKAFVSYLHPKVLVFRRRPITGDFAVMTTATHGRVVISLQSVSAGQALFAEEPWFFVPSSSASLREAFAVPPLLEKTMAKIAAHDEVFAARPLWNRRLVPAWILFLEVLLRNKAYARSTTRADNHEESLLPQLVSTLANPLKQMPAATVSELCEFAHFLHAALPVPLKDLLSEDESVRFLATMAVNAVAFSSLESSAGMLTAPVAAVVDGSRGERSDEAAADSAEGTGAAGASAVVADDFSGRESPRSTYCPLSLFSTGLECRCLLGAVSLLEHSCAPNAVLVLHRTSSGSGPQSSDSFRPLVEVRALRDIRPGERVSISYVAGFVSRQERQEVLWNRYYFHCQCSSCTHGADVLRGLRLGTEEWFPVGGGQVWARGGSLQTAPTQGSPEGGSADRRPSDDADIAAGVLLERRLAPRQSVVPLSASGERLIVVDGNDNDGTDGATQGPSGVTISLGTRHHLRVRAFLELCRAIVEDTQPPSAGDDTRKLKLVVDYVAAVTKDCFDEDGAALFIAILSAADDPLSHLFSGLTASAASTTGSEDLRQRMLKSSNGLKAALSGRDEANLRGMLKVRGGPDEGNQTTSLCLSVWEAAFTAVHAKLQGARGDGGGVSVAVNQGALSLEALSENLAIGVWLQLRVVALLKGSDRCLHWQEIVRERDLQRQRRAVPGH